MLSNICYKILSPFVDVYERKRISKRVDDSLAGPENRYHMEYTNEQWLKNGVPVAFLPQDRIALPLLGRHNRTENTLLAERRVERVHCGVDIVLKIKNIAFAAVVATIPVAYLINKGISTLAELF